MIYAHLANVVFNWHEMQYAVLRLVVLIAFTIADTANAVWVRYNYNQDRGEPKISFLSHIAGAIGGFMCGILFLRNLRLEKWEAIAWWLLFYVTMAYFGVGVVANIAIAFNHTQM